jgi:chromosomal replication initiation ATPase DnaA
MADVDDREVMTQPEKIDYILQKSCDYFGIDRDKVQSRVGKGRSPLWPKKRFIAYVLYKHTASTIPEIVSLLGYSQYTTVFRNIKGIEEELSEEFYGNEKVKSVYKELLSYLKLNGYENEKSNKAKETDS